MADEVGLIESSLGLCGKSVLLGEVVECALVVAGGGAWRGGPLVEYRDDLRYSDALQYRQRNVSVCGSVSISGFGPVGQRNHYAGDDH